MTAATSDTTAHPHPLTVLHLSEAFGGGVSTAIEGYCDLARDGIEHIVAVRRRPGHDVGAKLSNARVIELPHNPIAGYCEFRRIVASHHPDIIHAHSSIAGIWARFGPRGPQPVVYTPHCFAFERRDVPRLVRWAFRTAERLQAHRTTMFICNGQREVDLSRALAATVPAISVPCMPITDVLHAVESPEAPEFGDSVTPALARSAEELVVYGSGRLMAQKDPSWFAEVASQLRDVASIRFRWLGGGDEHYHTELTNAGVDVSGWLVRSELTARLTTGDLYLHSAAWEGCPITVFEAAAAGLPVLVRDIPAFDHLDVERLQTPHAAAAAIRKLAGDPDQIDELRVRSAALLAQQHDVAQTANLAAVYHGLVPPTPSSRPLKVTIVFPSTVVGGAEQWLFQLLDASDSNVQLSAILLDHGPVEAMLKERAIPFEVLPTGRHPIDVARTAARIATRLRKDRPDVVLANGVKAAFAALPACRWVGVRCVWVKHDYVWDEPFGRLAARLLDQVIGTSPDLIEAVGRQNGIVIPPPLPETEPLSRRDARESLGRHGVVFDERPVLGMCCRVVGYKGIDDAIRALACKEAGGWRLVVIGGVEATEPRTIIELEALAHDMGVHERVIFAGPIPHAGRLLAAFDAVAVLTKPHPDSRYRAEGFSITVLEAVVAGVPVIATAATPALKYVGGAGRAVEINSPEQVAAALVWATSARPISESYALDLRINHPTVSTLATQLWSELAEVCNRAGAAVSMAGTTTEPGSASMPISLVTTVLDEFGNGLDSLISSLLGQLSAGDELIVVDGGSGDGTLERLITLEQELATSAGAPQRGRLRVLSAPGTNISAGRNVGIAAACNEFIAITDAGCRHDAGWLDALRRACATGRADLVTGAYEAAVTGPVDGAFALVGFPSVDEGTHPRPLVRMYGRLLGRVFDARLCTGRSAAFRKSAWERVGGFPENLATGEDVTFGKRIAETGGACVLALDARVVWFQRPTLRGKAKMYAGYGRGDAESGDALLIGRNLVRGIAIVGAPLLLAVPNRWTRSLVGFGAAAYFSLPVQRGVRSRAGMTAVALMIPAAGVREGAKVGACLTALGRRASTQRSSR